MTESKVDFKSSVINEEFGFILYYLISKDDIFMADDFIDEYALRIRDMSISKNVKEIFKDCKNNCIFLILEYSDGVYHSYYEFKFFINTHKVYFNCYVKEAYENDDELILLDSYCFSFDDKFFNNLFNLPQIEEKTTSEPEQPAEDAEEQENPEQTPAEENKLSVELTLLERNLFEAHVKANDYYEQSIELGSEKFASSYLSQCDLLLKMIKESGLFSKYTVWLIQRNQETVGASK